MIVGKNAVIVPAENVIRVTVIRQETRTSTAADGNVTKHMTEVPETYDIPLYPSVAELKIGNVSPSSVIASPGQKISDGSYRQESKVGSGITVTQTATIVGDEVVDEWTVVRSNDVSDGSTAAKSVKNEEKGKATRKLFEGCGGGKVVATFTAKVPVSQLVAPSPAPKDTKSAGYIAALKGEVTASQQALEQAAAENERLRIVAASTSTATPQEVAVLDKEDEFLKNAKANRERLQKRLDAGKFK